MRRPIRRILIIATTLSLGWGSGLFSPAQAEERALEIQPETEETASVSTPPAPDMGDDQKVEKEELAQTHIYIDVVEPAPEVVTAPEVSPEAASEPIPPAPETVESNSGETISQMADSIPSESAEQPAPALEPFAETVSTVEPETVLIDSETDFGNQPIADLEDLSETGFRGFSNESRAAATENTTATSESPDQVNAASPDQVIPSSANIQGTQFLSTQTEQSETEATNSTPAAPVRSPASQTQQQHQAANYSPVSRTRPTQQALEIPSGYEQISPGIYVPREYIASSASVTSTYGYGLSPENLRQLQTIATPGTGTVGTEYPRYPLPHVVPTTSPFGPRWGRIHEGIDLGAPIGTPVLASLSGQVITAGWVRGYGYTVEIVLPSGDIKTVYGHLSEIYVQSGQWVEQGQVIASSGSTGRSTGPHLHFGIYERIDDTWEAININAIMAQSQQLLEAGTPSVIIAQAQSLQLPATDNYSYSQPSTEIRVALQRDATQIQLSFSSPALITTGDGQTIATLPEGQAYSLTRASNGINLSGQLMPSVFFVQPASGGLVAINGQWYRGRVLIGVRPDGLIAVNWVDLEDYIASVVGSESYPSWDQAALQAQAIAARSYAVVHMNRHANDPWYDLIAGPRHQAYGGIAREFDSTWQATQSTRGMVLTSTANSIHVFNGVVEALYASTQAITNSHHDGYGLSQHGAASLARQGYTFDQILAHYYPGTTIGMLEQPAPPAVNPNQNPFLANLTDYASYLNYLNQLQHQQAVQRTFGQVNQWGGLQ